MKSTMELCFSNFHAKTAKAYSIFHQLTRIHRYFSLTFEMCEIVSLYHLSLIFITPNLYQFCRTIIIISSYASISEMDQTIDFNELVD